MPVAPRKVWAAGLVVTAVATGGLAVGLLVAPETAAAAAGSTTERVSLRSNGTEGRSGNQPAISGDGRYVAFTSDGPFDDRDDDDSDRLDLDVYVRDTVAGTTTLISHAANPANAATGDSSSPSVSANGRYVAFQTSAEDIVPAGDDVDNVDTRIVVCDRDSDGDGVLNRDCLFTEVSEGEKEAVQPHISARGDVVSYRVMPTPVPSGPVLLMLPAPGAAPGPAGGSLRLVGLTMSPGGLISRPGPNDSVGLSAPQTLQSGGQTSYLYGQPDSALSADGRSLSWLAQYRRTDTVSERYVDTVAVYLWDVDRQDLIRIDRQNSDDLIPGAERMYLDPALSGDGRKFAFVDRTSPNEPIVYVYDRDPDGDGLRWPIEGEELERDNASRMPDGSPSAGMGPAFSADGRYLAFSTPMVGIHTGTDIARPNNRCEGWRPTPFGDGFCDVVIRDLVVDRARQAQVPPAPRLPAELASPSLRDACPNHVPGRPCEGTGHSYEPVLSADGSSVAYTSWAYDLAETPTDDNNREDAFVRRIVPGVTGAPQDFGVLLVGTTAVRDVPIRHVGFGPVAVRSVAVQGADPGDFDVFPGQSCTPVVLHMGDTCTVSIRFKPTVVGARTAVVRLTLTRGGPVDIAVQGRGFLIPTPGAGRFSAAPAQLDFGARGVLRTSPTQTVKVTNAGTGHLRMRGVSLVGNAPTAFPADYRITANGCATTIIPAGQSCSVTVAHRPLGVGARPAALRLDYEGPVPTVTASPGPTPISSPTAGTGPSPSAGASPSAGPAPLVPVLTHAIQLVGTGTAPTVAIRPVVPVGDITRISGANFPPNTDIRLGFEPLRKPRTVRTDADGAFTVSYLVMSHVLPGRQRMRGEIPAGTVPELTEPVFGLAPVLLTEGGLQPPDFKSR